jgi:hypothetical protein
MKTYYQCELSLNSSHTTAWIEERGAHEGAEVQIMPEREWWTVDKVYRDHPLPENALREYQRQNRHSLPSVEPIA